MLAAVEEVDGHADEEPDDEAPPVVHGQREHEHAAGEDLSLIHI